MVRHTLFAKVFVSTLSVTAPSQDTDICIRDGHDVCEDGVCKDAKNNFARDVCEDGVCKDESPKICKKIVQDMAQTGYPKFIQLHPTTNGFNTATKSETYWRMWGEEMENQFRRIFKADFDDDVVVSVFIGFPDLPIRRFLDVSQKRPESNDDLEALLKKGYQLSADDYQKYATPANRFQASEGQDLIKKLAKGEKSDRLPSDIVYINSGKSDVGFEHKRKVSIVRLAKKRAIFSTQCRGTECKYQFSELRSRFQLDKAVIMNKAGGLKGNVGDYQIPNRVSYQAGMVNPQFFKLKKQQDSDTPFGTALSLGSLEKIDAVMSEKPYQLDLSEEIKAATFNHLRRRTENEPKPNLSKKNEASFPHPPKKIYYAGNQWNKVGPYKYGAPYALNKLQSEAGQEKQAFEKQCKQACLEVDGCHLITIGPHQCYLLKKSGGKKKNILEGPATKTHKSWALIRGNKTEGMQTVMQTYLENNAVMEYMLQAGDSCMDMETAAIAEGLFDYPQPCEKDGAAGAAGAAVTHPKANRCPKMGVLQFFSDIPNLGKYLSSSAANEKLDELRSPMNWDFMSILSEVFGVHPLTMWSAAKQKYCVSSEWADLFDPHGLVALPESESKICWGVDEEVPAQLRTWSMPSVGQ